MEEEMLFIAQKLAFPTQVVFMVLYCSVLNQPRHFENSSKNLPTAFHPREARLDLGVHWEQMLSKYTVLAQRHLRTGRKIYESMRIT